MYVIKSNRKTNSYTVRKINHVTQVVRVGRRGLQGATGSQGPKGDQGDPATNLVQFVNGKQGVVVLNATDVGADPTGSASQALQDAKDYTDTEVSTLDSSLATVAKTGSYNDLSNKPTIPSIAGLATEAQVQDVQDNLDAHEADTANPHSVTKAQVGLGNVDNTSDADKPVSTAQQTALDGKLDIDSAMPSPTQSFLDISWITTFQTGHGWTNPFGIGAVTADTDVYTYGTQSLALAAGADNSSQVRKTGLSIDLDNQTIVVMLRVENLTPVSEVILCAASDNGLANSYIWQICPGAVPSPWFRAGEWALVTLPLPGVNKIGSPTNNIVAMQIQTIGAGSRVWLQGLGTIPRSPKGTITISFDDGYSSVIEAARKSMSQRGLTGTAYIIPGLINQTNFMTEAELTELAHTHGWDIQAHALATAPGRPADDLRTEFAATKRWLAAKGFGTVEHFAWAGGQQDPASIAVAREYFASARTIFGGQQETIPAPMPHRIRAMSSIGGGGGGVSVAETKTLIDNAVNYGGWCNLVFHRITDSPIAPENCSWSDFNEILDYIISSGAVVRTVSEAFDESKSYTDKALSLVTTDLSTALASRPPAVFLTQSEYDALSPPDANTEYNIIGG